MGACQEWDSNPRLQGRLRPERSALDRSAILTPGPAGRPLACLAPNVKPPPPPRTPPPSSWPPALVAPGLGAPAQSPAHRRRAAWASPGGDAVDAPQVPQPLSPSSAPRRRRAVSWSQGARTLLSDRALRGEPAPLPRRGTAASLAAWSPQPGGCRAVWVRGLAAATGSEEEGAGARGPAARRGCRRGSWRSGAGRRRPR